MHVYSSRVSSPDQTRFVLNCRTSTPCDEPCRRVRGWARGVPVIPMSKQETNNDDSNDSNDSNDSDSSSRRGCYNNNSKNNHNSSSSSRRRRGTATVTTTQPQEEEGQGEDRRDDTRCVEMFLLAIQAQRRCNVRQESCRVVCWLQPEFLRPNGPWPA